MTNPFNSGPIAPERNPPITPQYYSPRARFISAITLGITTTITTQDPNQFVVGQLVRLLIPSYWGSVQLNEVQGYVTQVLSDTQFVIDINSSDASAFGLSSSHPAVYQNPQVIPVGDVNTGPINSQGRSNQITNIPGSFIDISPAAGGVT